MKTAIILGRGIEGCGVTRYALEEQKWYHNHNIQCDVYASSDKKWGRKKAQEHNIIEFSNDEIKELSKKLNDNYDIIYYQSLPSKKGHSQEFQELFFDYLVKGIQKPIKLSHQNDHKAQSLARNSKIWETMAEMDASFTHSLSSPFAKKMQKVNPDVPLLKMGLGFDFDSLQYLWKPTNEQEKKVSYFGRFAGFKDPKRLIYMQPLLEKEGIVTKMKGIERSIGALDLFYEDPKDRKNTYRKNIYEVKKKDGAIEETPDKVWIYGPYNRLEGLDELSRTMFGADFYNLAPEAYGDNMEFAMCEIIAVGSIPLFDKHWADHCYHRSGKLFADIKDFAIYSDRNDLQDTVDQMKELAEDDNKRDKRRNAILEWAKSHCDNEIIYGDMHNKAIKVEKRNKKKPSELF